MRNLTEVLSNYVRDEIPRVIHDSLPELGAFYKNVVKTSIGVDRAGEGEIGQEFRINHLFSTGLAGLIQNANPLGSNVLTPPAGAQGLFKDRASTNISPFPDPVLTPHTTSIRRTLQLQKTTGNMSVPIQWLKVDELDATQLSQVTMDLKAVGELHALMEIQSFFMPSNNTLGRIANIVGTNFAAGWFTCQIEAGTGRIGWFRPGMTIDILAASAGVPQFGTAVNGTNRKNLATGTGVPIQLVVGAVDYLTRTLTVVAPTGQTIAGAALAGGAAIANGDFIIMAECHTSMFRKMYSWGIEDWTRTSGFLFQTGASTGAIDLAMFPQFKSHVNMTVNAPLSDGVLNQAVGTFLEAYPGADVDSFITTMGVTLNYLQNAGTTAAPFFYDRNGKTLSMAGGWNDVSFSFNGKLYNWYTTQHCMNGRLYGLKLKGGNLKRYVPPKIGGTDPTVGEEIEFLNTIAGGTSIYMLARNADARPLELLEAPFFQFKTIAPLDVRGVLLGGLTEVAL